MAITHGKLLQAWRSEVQKGQTAARWVLAEMLIPSGGARGNCYKFIQMVTGCSPSTISSVSEQLRTTGGDLEPPEHGLKKYWKNKAVQPKKVKKGPIVCPPVSYDPPSYDASTNAINVIATNGSGSTKTKPRGSKSLMKSLLNSKQTVAVPNFDQVLSGSPISWTLVQPQPDQSSASGSKQCFIQLSTQAQNTDQIQVVSPNAVVQTIQLQPWNQQLALLNETQHVIVQEGDLNSALSYGQILDAPVEIQTFNATNEVQLMEELPSYSDVVGLKSTDAVIDVSVAPAGETAIISGSTISESDIAASSISLTHDADVHLSTIKTDVGISSTFPPDKESVESNVTVSLDLKQVNFPLPVVKKSGSATGQKTSAEGLMQHKDSVLVSKTLQNPPPKTDGLCVLQAGNNMNKQGEFQTVCGYDKTSRNMQTVLRDPQNLLPGVSVQPGRKTNQTSVTQSPIKDCRKMFVVPKVNTVQSDNIEIVTLLQSNSKPILVPFATLGSISNSSGRSESSVTSSNSRIIQFVNQTGVVSKENSGAGAGASVSAGSHTRTPVPILAVNDDNQDRDILQTVNLVLEQSAIVAENMLKAKENTEGELYRSGDTGVESSPSLSETIALNDIVELKNVGVSVEDCVSNLVGDNIHLETIKEVAQ